MIIGRSITSQIAAHNVLKTGVHGVATDYVAKTTDSTQLIVNAAVKAAAGIVLSKLVNTYLLPTIMTTRGDIVIRNATVPARLAKGNSGDVLTMGANDPAWVAGLQLTTGTYDGNNGDARQIALGFKPKLVFVFTPTSAIYVIMYGSCSVRSAAASHADDSALNYIHATDGFVVDNSTSLMNTTGTTYQYCTLH